MDKKQNTIRRFDILSLDLKEIKRTLPSVLQTKLIVSKENEDSEPLAQTIIKPWMLSLSNQVMVSRNKISEELLHHCRNGFVLDDPYIRKTRFFVDYHRLHDPSLKRYYNSIPVRNRLEKLNLVTNANDAICSQKEFVDYLRYLDSNLNYNIIRTRKLEVEKELAEHFERLKKQKRLESQFTGILKKQKVEPKRELDLKEVERIEKQRIKAMRDKQVKSENRALGRMIDIRNEKVKTSRHENLEKEERSRRRKHRLIQNEIKKRTQLKNILDDKQEEARQRKRSLQMQKNISKMHADIDYFKTHSLFRQQALLKNIKMFEMYQMEQRRNKEDRNRHIEDAREIDQNKVVKKRRYSKEKERTEEIVDKIMRNIHILQKKYIERVDPADLVEVNRRLSLITKALVSDCVGKMNWILGSLGIGVSKAVLAARAVRFIELCIIIIPEFGKTKCSSVQKRIARIISKTIVQIVRERVKLIKENYKGEQEAESDVEKPSNEKVQQKKSSVTLDEDAHVIGVASYSEFIGDLVNTKSQKPTKTYDLNREINRDLERFFDIITKTTFDFSEKMDDRDFTHLYDFQKYFLYKAMRRLLELVKIKSSLCWNEKEQFISWKNLGANLEDLSNEAAKAVMNYPDKIEEFPKIIKKISKFICTEISRKLEKENIDVADVDDPDREFDRQSEFTRLSETESEFE